MENPENGCNFGELGLQGTRPAEVLKLWLGLRQLGENGIDQILQNSLKRRQIFVDHLDNEKFLILSGSLHIAAFKPRFVDLGIIEIWSSQTKHILLNNGFMLSRPYYSGSYHLKAVLGNPHTKYKDICQLAELINSSLDSSKITK